MINTGFVVAALAACIVPLISALPVRPGSIDDFYRDLYDLPLGWVRHDIPNYLDELPEGTLKYEERSDDATTLAGSSWIDDALQHVEAPSFAIPAQPAEPSDDARPVVANQWVEHALQRVKAPVFNTATKRAEHPDTTVPRPHHTAIILPRGMAERGSPVDQIHAVLAEDLENSFPYLDQVLPRLPTLAKRDERLDRVREVLEEWLMEKLPKYTEILHEVISPAQFLKETGDKKVEERSADAEDLAEQVYNLDAAVTMFLEEKMGNKTDKSTDDKSALVRRQGHGGDPAVFGDDGTNAGTFRVDNGEITLISCPMFLDCETPEAAEVRWDRVLKAVKSGEWTWN